MTDEIFLNLAEALGLPAAVVIAVVFYLSRNPPKISAAQKCGACVQITRHSERIENVIQEVQDNSRKIDELRLTLARLEGRMD